MMLQEPSQDSGYALLINPGALRVAQQANALACIILLQNLARTPAMHFSEFLVLCSLASKQMPWIAT